ncbi:MAG: hypothetical protein JO349_04920 [Candidatus Eremiobacteraeota bacterium]|nr:hypothetical protein [Candidatus Eremiobacteraeota bacterium]
MKLYAGIDGGQSSTVALIADERQTILGHGVSGPCDHIGQPADSPRFAHALEDAIGAALQEAALPPDSTFEAVVAGISGYEGAIHGIAPKLNAPRVVYLHDAQIAHAGAFELGAGIIVIAGTGSVAYGRDARGGEMMVGGWGYLFGDGGSAFSIVAKSLSVAMQLEDAGQISWLDAHALQYFKRSSLREIARAFYTGEIDRPHLASFAAELLRLAETGGKDERMVPYLEAMELVELVRACANCLGYADEPIDVALCGGTFGSAWYREATAEGIGRYLPSANVVSARHDPVTGALLLAYKEGR